MAIAYSGCPFSCEGEEREDEWAESEGFDYFEVKGGDLPQTRRKAGTGRAGSKSVTVPLGLAGGGLRRAPPPAGVERSGKEVCLERLGH